jgi:antitoxin ParD1/3/4
MALTCRVLGQVVSLVGHSIFSVYKFQNNFLTSLFYNKACYSLLLFWSKEVQIMNISLTPQLEALVKNKVESGLYGSASEVMRDALRLLEVRDRRQFLRVEELRAEIKKGLDSGEPTPLDVSAIKARGRKRLAAQQNEANA